MLLTIHRGARQVGGNCIELESGGARVLLDIGAPLDLAEGEQATLPKTLRLGRDDGQLLGVIVSHAHQDHYGLWNHVPASVPCYIGKQSLDVMRAARPFLRNAFIPANALTYDTGQPFQLGPFRVTPYLVDHSAFNAHALLVEADGKRSLYTGDLRAHGWKRGVLHRLLKSCPRPLDALVMEGTSVGRVEPGKKPKTEAALVGELVTSMKETPGLVLALFASQNIDRFVTFQKAANSAGRTMVVDAYTAEIIRASGLESLPDPTKSDLLVFLPYRMKQKILREGNAHTMDKYKGRRIFLTGRDTVKDRAGKLVIVFRDSMRGELSEHGCLDGARLIYSMWSGYLQKHLKPLPKWCSDHGVEFEARHTSGHADLATLKRIVRALVPTRLIPIHTSDTDAFAREFPGARLLPDGVPLAL